MPVGLVKFLPRYRGSFSEMLFLILADRDDIAYRIAG